MEVGVRLHEAPVRCRLQLVKRQEPSLYMGSCETRYNTSAGEQELVLKCCDKNVQRCIYTHPRHLSQTSIALRSAREQASLVYNHDGRAQRRVIDSTI